MSDAVRFEASEKLKLRAVCVACGEIKKRVFDKCASCDYRPRRDYEIARALILSESFTINDGVSLGKDFEQLEVISESIKRGRPYAYEHDEQQNVLSEYRRYLRENSSVASWWSSNKWLLFFVAAVLVCGVVVLTWLLL